MPSPATKELFTPFFATLTDPRVQRSQRHALLDIVILAVCATVGGANGWADIERFGKAKLDFFRSFLDLPNGIPSHDTFGRVFALLEPAVLLRCIQEWLAALGTMAAGEVVAIDGKTLRGSFDTAAGQHPLHLVSAWATDARLLLGQVAVDTKSNEIKAIPLLLQLIDVKGCIVTIDAMGCQKDIATCIRAAGGDYVLSLKDNHPTLHNEVRDLFLHGMDTAFAGMHAPAYETVDEDHGRREKRSYRVLPVTEELRRRHPDWKGLRSVGMVFSERQVGAAEPTWETRFFLSSLTARVRRFAAAVRGHWGIENRLHWSLDVTFAEDQSRIRKDHGPANLGMIRRLALSILQQDTSTKETLRGKRLTAGWDDQRLLKILTSFSGD